MVSRIRNENIYPVNVPPIRYTHIHTCIPVYDITHTHTHTPTDVIALDVRERPILIISAAVHVDLALVVADGVPIATAGDASAGVGLSVEELRLRRTAGDGSAGVGLSVEELRLRRRDTFAPSSVICGMVFA